MVSQEHIVEQALDLAGTGRYKENQIKILLGLLRWAGNPDVAKWHILFGDTSPTRVRWLDDDQARLVRAEAKGIEKIIVHCELDLAMRRESVLSLKVSSFVGGRISKVTFHGKGRNGGKNLTVSYHPDTEYMLEEYLTIVRRAEIEKARKKNPAIKVPENLLIYERAGNLYPYKKTAIDDFLEDVGKRVGFHLSNHDLRRTCGRMMYRSGVKIEHIVKIFGHEDTRTTIKYLGLDIEDMSNAMRQYAQYQKTSFEPQTVHFEDSQEKSGQSGIRHFDEPDRRFLKSIKDVFV